MIVADTNLIAYLIIQGAQTDLARATLRKQPTWAAPVLWRSEFRNVLALYMRPGHLSLAGALEYMEAAEDLLRDNEYHVESAPVLGLAEQSGCSAYDCEFLHVAQELGVPLVTSDRQILRAFPKTALSLSDFAM